MNSKRDSSKQKEIFKFCGKNGQFPSNFFLNPFKKNIKINPNTASTKMEENNITEEIVEIFDRIGTWSKRRDLNGQTQNVFIKGEYCYKYVKEIQRYFS